MPKRKNRKTNIKKAYGKKLKSNWSLMEDDTLKKNDDENVNEEDISHHALTSPEQFSEDMLKYWRQRRSLFALFDGSSFTGQLPLLDRESWYSITPEPIAARIAQRCRCTTILDPFCGVGGNSIQFALTCQNVIAIDIDPIKIKMAKHNAKVYGVEKYITFLQGDWNEFAQAWIRETKGSVNEEQKQVDESRWKGCQKLKFDVVFLSPPWGGVDYRTLAYSTKGGNTNTLSSDTSIDQLDESYYPLSALAPDGGKELYETAKQITPNICMYVPRTVDLRELSTLVDHHQEENQHLIDIEEQWLRGRCKALSCYFGELANWVEEENV